MDQTNQQLQNKVQTKRNLDAKRRKSKRLKSENNLRTTSGG